MPFLPDRPMISLNTTAADSNNPKRHASKSIRKRHVPAHPSINFVPSFISTSPHGKEADARSPLGDLHALILVGLGLQHLSLVAAHALLAPVHATIVPLQLITTDDAALHVNLLGQFD